TKPTAAVDPRESPLPAAGAMEMPAEAGTPPLVPRESRLPAESDVGPDDETKPTPAELPSVTASDPGSEGPRDEAAGDPGSPSPAEGGRMPPGPAEAGGPSPSRPLAPVILEALKALAQREAAILSSLTPIERP